MDNEIDREHRNRNASGGSNLGWGRVSAATNIQITYRLLMLYLGIIQGSGVLWWYGVDSVSPASNCPVHRRQNCRKLTTIIRIRGGLLRPRPDGGDPAPPAQPAAGRPAGGAPQHQRARAETELHTGGMSWYYTSYCHVMSGHGHVMTISCPRWVRCGLVWWTRWWTTWWTWTRSTPGRRQTTETTWTRWTCPTQACRDIKYLLSLESSPQQYIIICNIIFSGSIEHFEKLFYPKIPCKNCSTCYENFSDEIKWL